MLEKWISVFTEEFFEFKASKNNWTKYACIGNFFFNLFLGETDQEKNH
jgi:hypothetical protein